MYTTKEPHLLTTAFDTNVINVIIIVVYCLMMSIIFIIGFFSLIKSDKRTVKAVASPEDTIRIQKRISELQAEKMDSKSENIFHTEPPSSMQMPFDSIKEQLDDEELELLEPKEKGIISKQDTGVCEQNVDFRTSICEEDVNIKNETSLDVFEEPAYEIIENPTSEEIRIIGEDEDIDEEMYEILEYFEEEEEEVEEEIN
ncbi:uncharacterized protein LOC111623890 isoform X1 [Centruroides sculpturatus]|uniref:uncharacterized protein LOC111623890 isoform X1 n=2 Tax=Centruroides sculpturatus TaxID=218467 RepID=UPI000C6DA684|nr:uncharacterized protein LOC111623890 isoform X1 [Centruroides sculpturatus]XP_023222389.1 uncharacterized protein LOC111623890 isoform X1 [Centruroides sculpturatus]